MPAPDPTIVVSRIQNALGCSKDMAKAYADVIGDNPEVAHGKILLRNEDNRIIAYLPVSVLDA